MYCLLHTSFAVNSYARAYDSLKTVCNEVCLSAPHRITSVSMRKYMATLTQVFYHSFLSESINDTCNQLHTVIISINLYISSSIPGNKHIDEDEARVIGCHL